MKEEKTKPDESIQSSTINLPLRILLVAAWFGLLTGLCEGIFGVGWRLYFEQSRIGMSPHVLWMAPISELFFFIVGGSILALVAWRFPRLVTMPIACFAFATLSLLALLDGFPELHIIARVLLAVGIAVQTVRIIAKRQDAFVSIVRITCIILAIVVFGLALGTFVVEGIAERRAIAKLPAATAKAPNVILITLDTVRAKSLSLYGYQRRTTPELERIAEESTVYEKAIATSSWTLPSHASIFTGRFPHELQMAGGVLRPTHNTLGEELSSRGYDSAGFVANLEYCPWEIGFGRGMIRYEDYPISAGQIVLSSSVGRQISNNGFVRRIFDYHNTLNRKNAETINANFLDWLSSRDQKRPYFAFLNYYDAHEPLLPPAPFDQKFGPPRPPIGFEYSKNDGGFASHKGWSNEDINGLRNAYDNSIAYLDHHLGLLLGKLSELGSLDNTVVIITSDHGELLGEHGFYGHGNTLYVDTVRVPLLIRYPPRVKKGVRIEESVSLRNLPATILDLLDVKSQSSFPGRSLSNDPDETVPNTSQNWIFSELDKAPWLGDVYPASKNDIKSLVTEQYHYIFNGDGNEELYDLKSDPNELRNLSQSSDLKEVMVDLRSALAAMVNK